MKRGVMYALDVALDLPGVGDFDGTANSPGAAPCGTKKTS
jgi:hypothetical protein